MRDDTGEVVIGIILFLAEVLPASGILTGTEKARLCAFAVKYQQRTGLRLSPARDLGHLRG
jgi:uncharacterized membrane protein